MLFIHTGHDANDLKTTRFYLLLLLVTYPPIWMNFEWMNLPFDGIYPMDVDYQPTSVACDDSDKVGRQN